MFLITWYHIPQSENGTHRLLRSIDIWYASIAKGKQRAGWKRLEVVCMLHWLPPRFSWKLPNFQVPLMPKRKKNNAMYWWFQLWFLWIWNPFLWDGYCMGSRCSKWGMFWRVRVESVSESIGTNLGASENFGWPILHQLVKEYFSVETLWDVQKSTLAISIAKTDVCIISKVHLNKFHWSLFGSGNFIQVQVYNSSQKNTPFLGPWKINYRKSDHHPQIINCFHPLNPPRIIFKLLTIDRFSASRGKNSVT